MRDTKGRRARSRVNGKHYRSNEFIRPRIIRGIAIRGVFLAYSGTRLNEKQARQEKVW